MISHDVEHEYQTGRNRWPQVTIALADFKEHFLAVLKENLVPKYPDQFYLAGAAGHRDHIAWATVESEFSPKVQQVLERLPLADFSTDDLWEETIAYLIEDEEFLPCLLDGRYHAKIIKYRGLIKLVNYFITKAKWIAIQQKRKLKPILGGDPELLQAEPDLEDKRPDCICINREAQERLVSTLSAAWKKLTPEQQFLITMIYRQGMKQKEAAMLLNISEFSANRKVKKAISVLKSSLSFLEVELNLFITKQAWNSALENL